MRGGRRNEVKYFVEDREIGRFSLRQRILSAMSHSVTRFLERAEKRGDETKARYAAAIENS